MCGLALRCVCMVGEGRGDRDGDGRTSCCSSPDRELSAEPPAGTMPPSCRRGARRQAGRRQLPPPVPAPAWFLLMAHP